MKKILLFALMLTSLLPFSVQAQKRGLVMSNPCPFSCRTQGIAKSHCRDWREGNTCYVEDTSKPPAPAAAQPSQPPPPPVAPPPSWSGSNSSVSADCRQMNRYDLRRPRVEIDDVHSTGNVFKNKYKVRGSIEGNCLLEAGAFENGRKTQDIQIRSTPDFGRYEFELVVNGDKSPEIRVYNQQGDRDIVRVDEDGSDSRNSRSDRSDGIDFSGLFGGGR